LKAYAKDFYQCYVTNKSEKKANFSRQIELLNQILAYNSDKWNKTTDQDFQNALHAMSEDIRAIIGKYT
jgi:hypothetical protein